MTRRFSNRTVGQAILGSFVLGLLLFCLPQANAEQCAVAQADRVVETLTIGQLHDIMRGEGYGVTIDEDGDIAWKIEGYQSYIFTQNDDGTLLFRIAFSDGNATLRKVNEWNKTRLYSRSYLDDDGDPVLELDLDMEGGVRVARVIDYLRTCKSSFLSWKEEVVD